MELNEKLKDIFSKAALKVDISILVSDGEKIIYYIGNIDKCCDYINSKISDEFKNILKILKKDELSFYTCENKFKIIDNIDEYGAKALYKVSSQDIILLFLKASGNFTVNDRLVIDSVTFLANRIK